MMTRDERRAIAARADKVMLDETSSISDVTEGLLRVIGVDSPDPMTWDAEGRWALARIRELCELPDESEEYKRSFDEGFHSADDWYVEMDGEEMAAHGLLRAPRDADGAPILPGDLVTHPDTDGAQKVASVSFGVSGNRVCCLGGFETMETSSMCHVRDTPEFVADDLDKLAMHKLVWGDRPTHDRLTSLSKRLREMGRRVMRGDGDDA